MIYGIGTDMVRVQRLQDSLDRHGDRFARRILADSEWEEYVDSPQKAQFLAKRFAAKEAAAKALGTGFRHGLSLQDIAVGHDGLGKPLLEFNETLSAHLGKQGIGNAHLSLSDEKEYALAFVILEKI
jgi:holo-[acyl-carrier protein] synthase